MNEKGILMVINSEKGPLRERHICWYAYETQDKHPEVVLVELVECTYDHPDVPGMATVKVIETRFRGSFKKTSTESSHVQLLMHAQDNVSLMERLKAEGKELYIRLKDKEEDEQKT